MCLAGAHFRRLRLCTLGELERLYRIGQAWHVISITATSDVAEKSTPNQTQWITFSNRSTCVVNHHLQKVEMASFTWWKVTFWAQSETGSQSTGKHACIWRSFELHGRHRMETFATSKRVEASASEGKVRSSNRDCPAPRGEPDHNLGCFASQPGNSCLSTLTGRAGQALCG